MVPSQPSETNSRFCLNAKQCNANLWAWDHPEDVVLSPNLNKIIIKKYVHVDVSSFGIVSKTVNFYAFLQQEIITNHKTNIINKTMY